MAFDAFLKIDGVDGESKDTKHTKWIEVLSFSSGMSQPTSSTKSSAGGATAARVNMQDINIVKHIDISTPKLAEACCTGKHFPTVTIELCRAGGDKMKYMVYKMTNAIVSSISSGGTPGGAEDVPTESVSFNFTKLEWAYTQQGADGKAGGNVSAGWDLEKNVKV